MDSVVKDFPAPAVVAGTHPATAGAPVRILWLACFLGYVAIGATIQVMPFYVQARFAAGALEAGLAVTVGSLATMVARPLAGRWADARGGRAMVMLGAILAAIGGAGHLLAPDLGWLVAARLALGAGEGALFTAAIGWVLAAAPAHRRGRIAGRFGLSMWGGMTGGPVLGALLLHVGGFTAVWMAASLLPALGFVALLGTGRAAPAPAGDQARRAWLPRAAWRPGASYAFASIGYGVVAACLVPRFTALGLPGRDVALAVFGIAFLATRFVGSAAVDRFGPPRVLACALLGEAAGLAALALAGRAATALAATALAGAGIALIYPCYVAIVTGAAAPREKTTALGAVISAWDLGAAVGGPLGGALAGNSYTGAFLAASAACLIAVLIAPRRQPGPG